MSGDSAAFTVNAAAVPQTDVVVGMTRLEAKLDVAIAHQGAQISTQGAKIDDHETRIRAKEAESYVTTRGLWTAVLGAISAATALVASGIIPINR